MNFVFISPIAWDNSGGAHRPVQLACELARRGYSVTYAEIEKSRTRPPAGNPRILTFEDLGWRELDMVRAWYGFEYSAPAAPSARLLDTILPSERGVVLCAAPFRPALELLPELAQAGYALVYDVLDDISELRALGSYCYDALAENYLAQCADLIVTLSPRLRDKFSGCGNVVLIRDGVDLAPFRDAEAAATAQPENPITRGELTLGFWGTMWEYNLDIPLLVQVTYARPTWQFHFIGAYDLDPARPSLAQSLAAPNVHFHPSVTRQTLARYAANVDVCLLPTPVTPFNLARDPLKVYEYLACYKPVVATQLEQLAAMPYVYLSRDAAEFLRNIETAARDPIDRAQLDAYLNEQTWAKRTDQLLTALNAVSPRAHSLPPPPRGAMPDAAKDLERWQAFARHLDRMVQDRETHIHALEGALQASSWSGKLKSLLRGR